jgi:CzcA family heavy metal efflux pump
MKIRHVLPVVSPEGLSQVSFRSTDGRTFLLGDVARIVEGHPPMIGDGIINDGPGLLLIVEKFPWANTFEVTHNVERALEDLKPAIAGIVVDPTIFRPATFIETAIDNLKSALLMGVILVIGVLFLFLYEWRVALISMVAIPLSLVTATLILAAMGATINTMILAGLVIAIGAVVDDAIIDVENIVRRLRESEGDSTRSIARIIVEASLEVRKSIVYATLIIVLAIVPVFFLEGLSGAFFQPLATSYSLALLASMLVALTLTPALCYLLLSAKPVRAKEPPFVSMLKRGYAAVLTPIVKAPAAAVIVTLLVSFAGFALLPFLGQALLPSFKERDFLMHWVTKPGTSHDEMNRITIAASNELRAVPGVQNFGAHVGRAVAADEVVGINFTENWISVHPDADYDATLAKIQEVVDGYPGLYRDVMTYLKERIREVLTGSSEAIVIRVYGPELPELRKTVANIKTALADVKGMKELHGELIEEIPHIAVKVDLEKAQNYGLKPGDVRRAASAIIGGIELSDIYLSSQLYDILLIGSPHLRQNLTTVQNLMIDVPKGGQVRLADVASVEMLPTPNVVKRERASRRMDIAANLSGERDLGSVVRDVKERLKTLDFPTQYHAELIGEHTERKAAEQRIFIFSLAALLGIFVLLQASFGSWRLATAALFTLPSALVGGIVAAWISGGIISLGTLVGFITVLGIAGRNAILLINHYQHLEQYEGMAFGRELALRGAMERLSPILMTALTTGLGIVPLVISGNLPGHEIEHPMAVVILGGLVSSSLLNLFILPTIYLWLAKTDPARIPKPSMNFRENFAT